MGNYFKGLKDLTDSINSMETPGGPRPDDPGLDQLPFNLIDDRRFEILAYRLKCFQFRETARTTLMQGVGERGRDVVVYNNAGAIAEIVQCKRLQDRMTAPEVRQELLKLAIHAHLEPAILGTSPVRYELWCSGGLTEPAAKLFGEWPKGWTADILKEDAGKVIGQYKSFNALSWDAVSTFVTATFPQVVQPHPLANVDITSKVRVCVPVYEVFFQGKVVMAADAVKASLRELLDEAHSREQSGDVGDVPEEVSIVKPKEFDGFQKKLHESFGLLIVGEPGVGKTTAAEQLIFEHRTLPKPFALVRPAAPDDLRALRSKKEPTLVFVDDPFGRYAPSPQGHEWAVELAGLCQHLKSDLRLLVTSRKSFAAPHMKEKDAARLSQYVMSLKGSGYDSSELLADCLGREPGLDQAALDWVLSYADLILQELSRPLSYDNLAAHVASLPPVERSEAALQRMVKAASAAGLGRELKSTFANAAEPIQKGLIGVWIALELWSRSDVLDAQLDNVAADLVSEDAEVKAVIRTLEQHQWLKRSKNRLQMHPSYVEACLHVALERPVLASRVLAAVFNGLRQRQDVDALWNAYRVAKRVDLQLTPESESTARAAARDSLLRAANARTDVDFVAGFGLLETGPTDDPVALLARALRPGPNARGMAYFLGRTWSRPRWDAATLAQVQADPAAAIVVRAFARQKFPTTRRLYEGADALVNFLYEITDVSAEFDELLKSIDEGDDSTSEIIALGAVRSTNANLENILQRGFGIFEQAEAWWEENSDDDKDSAYGDWLTESYHDSVRPAAALIDAVLLKWHSNGGDTWVTRETHPLVFERFIDRIVGYKLASTSTIKHVFSQCPMHLRAKFVREVAQDRKQLDLALELLADVPGGDWAKLIRISLLRAFDDDEIPKGAEIPRVETAVKTALGGLSPAIRVAIIHELRAQVSTAGLTVDVLATASSAEQEAVAALAADSSASASAPALELLEGVVASETSASADALRVLARHGRAQAARVFAWLSPATDPAKAQGALAALEFLTDAEAKTFAGQGLKHRRAAVRCEALGVLGKFPDEAATRAIVSVVQDPMASVRKAAATALAGRSSSEAHSALLRLLCDTTDTSDRTMQYEEDPIEIEFGVASAAARALSDAAPWSPELATAVTSFLESDAATAQNAQVRRLLATSVESTPLT
jgi:hypothetical protein